MGQLVERCRDHFAGRLLLAEAVVCMLAARCALAVLSFQQLTGLLQRSTCQPELNGNARRRAREEVRGAIFRVWQSSSIPTTCLHRAIAAQLMLRRRRVGTTLYFGARTLPGCGLTTHAWVQDGDEGVVGHRVAQLERYHILARYSGPEWQE